MKREANGKRTILMLLSNAFDPDPRVLAEARALVQSGYSVDLLAWDRDKKCPEHEVIEGIDVHRIYISSTHGRGSTQALVMIRVLWALIRSGLHYSFDVVHAHDFDTLPAGVVLSNIRRKPLVYDSHENYTAMLHGSIPGFLERFIFHVETLLLRSVDLLITVGEILREEFLQRGAKNCVVVGNWKSRHEYRLGEQVKQAGRREVGIPQDSLAVAFIANLSKERKIAELLEAARRKPEVHFIFGGKGPAADAVKVAASQLHNVHYLGFVQPSQIARYTAASDVVFYGFDTANPNSKYSAPNKLFEALAAGKAMLTGRFGEIGRIVEQHGCGILIDNYSPETITAALDSFQDKNTLAEMKSRAAEVGDSTYNWECAESVLVSAYQRVMQGQTAPVVDKDADKALAKLTGR